MAVKYNCGTIVPTSCSPYTGIKFTFLSEEDAATWPCDINADEAFGYINIYLTPLVEGNDFSELDLDCLEEEFDDPLDLDAKQLHQVEIAQICLLKGIVESLQTQIDDLDIGAELITIDLGCLEGDAVECEVSDNTYAIQNILQLLVAKICDHETRISNLES